MKDVLPAIERWRADGEKVALATVVATRRSAPRPVGCKLAVSETRRARGIRLRRVRRGGRRARRAGGARRRAAAAPHLRHQRRPRAHRRPPVRRRDRRLRRTPRVSLLDELARVAGNAEPAVVFTVLEGEHAGAKLVARPDADPVGDAPRELVELLPALLREGHSHVVEHEGTKVFAEVFGPPPRLVVVGAVDTAEELCRAGKALGWRTAVADARARFATHERLPSADEIVVGWPDEALRAARPRLRRRRRRPDARRQVRRPGDRRRARGGGLVRRRARLAPRAAGAARAVARGRRRGGRARPRPRPVRARHRRREPGRDRALDPRRDPRRPRRARRRPPPRVVPADPRGTRAGPHEVARAVANRLLIPRCSCVRSSTRGRRRSTRRCGSSPRRRERGRSRAGRRSST